MHAATSTRVQVTAMHMAAVSLPARKRKALKEDKEARITYKAMP